MDVWLQQPCGWGAPGQPFANLGRPLGSAWLAWVSSLKWSAFWLASGKQNFEAHTQAKPPQLTQAAQPPQPTASASMLSKWCCAALG